MSTKDRLYWSTAGAHRERVDDAELEKDISRRSFIFDFRRRRPRYFDGRFLAARDLTREQTYFLTRQADLGRICGCGVGLGLHVDVDSNGRDITVSAGHGLTHSGEMVLLREDVSLDVTDIETSQRLDAVFGLEKQPRAPARSRTGLFVLALRPVEFTANPVASYPTSMTGRRGLEYGDIVEGVVFSLVPYSADITTGEIDDVRSRVARDIFLLGNRRGTPEEVLPLALLALNRGLVAWVDPYIVRREAGIANSVGFAFGDRAVRESFFLQHDRHLDDIMAERNKNGAGLSFGATEHFFVLPPTGRLPAAAISAKSGELVQSYFPPEMNVELSVVPNDELPALVEESLALPPIDLGMGADAFEGVSVQVLLPVAREDFGQLVQKITEKTLDTDAQGTDLLTLGTSTRSLFGASPARLARLKPIQSLRSLKGIRIRPAIFDTKPVAISPWVEALTDYQENAESGGHLAKLWYVRKRNASRVADVYYRSQPLNALPDEVPNLSTTVEQQLKDNGYLESFYEMYRTVGDTMQAMLVDLVSRNIFVDQPVLTAGLIAEGQTAKSDGFAWVPIFARYGREKMGDGMKRLTKQAPEINEKKDYRTFVAKTSLVPEIDETVVPLDEEKVKAFAEELLKIIEGSGGTVEALLAKYAGTGSDDLPELDKAVVKRLGDYNYLQPFYALYQGVEASIQEKLVDIISSEALGEPLLMAGVIVEGQSALDDASAWESIFNRYSRSTLGEGIARVKKMDASISAVAQYRTFLAATSRVPEIDAAFIPLSDQDVEGFNKGLIELINGGGGTIDELLAKYSEAGGVTDPDPGSDPDPAAELLAERLKDAGETRRYKTLVKDAPEAEKAALDALMVTNPFAEPLILSGLLSELILLAGDKTTPVVGTADKSGVRRSSTGKIKLERAAKAEKPTGQTLALATIKDRYTTDGLGQGVKRLTDVRAELNDLAPRIFIADQPLVPELDARAKTMASSAMARFAKDVHEAAVDQNATELRAIILGEVKPTDPKEIWGKLGENARQRFEESGESERFLGVIERLPDEPRQEALERIKPLLEKATFDHPLVVSGFVSELSEAVDIYLEEADIAAIEAVVARYSDPKLGQGIDRLVQAETGLSNVEERRVIADAGIVPELDAMFADKKVVTDARAPQLAYAVAEMVDAGDREALAQLVSQKDNKLLLLAINNDAGKVDRDDPAAVAQLRSDLLNKDAGKGLSRLLEADARLGAGSRPQKLAAAGVLARIDKLSMNVTDDAALKALSTDVVKLSALRQDKIDEAVVNLEGKYGQ